MQTIRIDAGPHPSQRIVHDHPARFKVLAAGRRWGKTRLGVNECLDVAAEGGRAWWVSPTYKTSAAGWRPLRRLGSQIGAEVRRVDRQVILPGGGTVEVRSADNPDSLRSEGLDFVVLDECAFMTEAAWSEALRPALSDRLGKALFISTPKGRNFFWRNWQRGTDGGDWASWQFPTADNPYIAAGEIETARQELPERIFRQEYLAEFIDETGSIFRRITEAATATESGPLPGHQYAMGVDWAKHQDFTAITVMDINTKSLAYMDRFNQIDYALQTNRLRALYEQYQPTVIVAERNAMGEPLIEQLQRDGLPVRAFTTSNATKAIIIDSLALAFERGDIHILPDRVLVGELQAYEATPLPSGTLRYSAPEGMHDDCVMSLALAWHALDDRHTLQVFDYRELSYANEL